MLPERNVLSRSLAFAPDSVTRYLKTIWDIELLTASEEVNLAKRIEAGLLAGDALAHLPGPALSTTLPEELRWLSADGARAKTHFILANLRLVVSVAKQYAHRGLALSDLIQEGNIGLIHAVERFDFSQGFRFATYATWRIRQAISRGLAADARTIRLPVHVCEALGRIASARRRMIQILGHEPTLDELSRELGLPPGKIIEIERYARTPESLDLPVWEIVTEGLRVVPFGWTLKSLNALDPQDSLDAVQRQERLGRLLGRLGKREAAIIRMRFGLSDGGPRTLGQIGDVYGLSRDRIRQIESKAMKRLRLMTRSESPP
jgi:RNA polymerase primary sigma factor